MTPLESLALAGRSLDDELSALVRRYGADAVRKAAKEATKKKRGRPAERDWPLLKPWFELDIQDWLAGENPFERRSNYLIAKEFAAQYPGHNPFATKDRIERKLAEKRQWMILASAENRSREDYPFELHFKALRGLATVDCHPVWDMMLERALGTVARYRERFGEPEPSLSMQALETRLSQSLGGFGPYGLDWPDFQASGLKGSLGSKSE